MYTAVETLPNRPQTLRIPAPLRIVPQALGKELSFSRGQTLFYAGDDADAFFEILGGTVRCCRLTHDGRRQVFRFAEAGDLLGLAAENTYGYSAEAVTPVTVRRRRLSELDQAMADDPVLRRRVLQSLRDELAATRTQMMLLGRMNATERLASFLLAVAEECAGECTCVDLPMSRTDIADYLGLAIETVSRKFSELSTLGVIRLETPQRIRITDLQRMEALAEAA